MENDIYYTIKIQVWKDGRAFGPGISQLLKDLEKTRSLRKTAQNVNMAYSRAWNIIRQCEKTLGYKLVDGKAGGKKGGYTILTEHGKNTLQAYDDFVSNAQEEISKLFNNYTDKFR